jgi:hypothetical protein
METEETELDFKRVEKIGAAIAEIFNTFDADRSEVIETAVQILEMAVLRIKCPDCRKRFAEDVQERVDDTLAHAIAVGRLQENPGSTAP